MSDWTHAALRVVAQEEPAILVTIIGAMGSTPREAGTKMLVTNTSCTGTIGGGRLEEMAIAQSRALLLRNEPEYLVQDYPLGPFLRQCCGGHVRLLLERLVASDKEWIGKIATINNDIVLETLLKDGRREKKARPLAADEVRRSIPIQASTTAFDPSSLRSDIKAIYEFFAPSLTPLLLFGAGHVGRAVMHIAATLPFSLRWIDSRAAEFPQKIPSNVEIAVTYDPVAEVCQAPANAFYLVMTHSHDLDRDLVMEILSRSDAAYCGLIGSATKRARFLGHLQRRGFTDYQRAQLTCPIGSGGPVGKEPAVIAVAVAAELLNVRAAISRILDVEAPCVSFGRCSSVRSCTNDRISNVR